MSHANAGVDQTPPPQLGKNPASKTVLVTGSAGFIGQNLLQALQGKEHLRVLRFERESTAQELQSALLAADVVFHLAGVNRPVDPGEFTTGNTGLTETICRILAELGRAPLIVMSSSIQAELDNPYGISKREAELALQKWARQQGGRAAVWRLKNVFGKWCRPNYNSVTATFCHNVAHGLPVQINDPLRELELIYIDDVIEGFCQELDAQLDQGELLFRSVAKSRRITLGELAGLIEGFRNSRHTLELPSFQDEFIQRLYATYLSHLDPSAFAYRLTQRSDARGSLAEFIKQPHFGQVFVSRTLPGVTRGNHFHHTKTEKFLVLEGEAVIRFRAITGDRVIEYKVNGREFQVVDIPPGYTHSIENVGSTELVTLFWASEIFDRQKPDVYFQNVLP